MQTWPPSPLGAIDYCDPVCLGLDCSLCLVGLGEVTVRFLVAGVGEDGSTVQLVVAEILARDESAHSWSGLARPHGVRSTWGRNI